MARIFSLIKLPNKNLRMDASIEKVQGALSMLYDIKSTTSSQRREANNWLQTFQKTVTFELIKQAAWTIADQLIRLPDASLEQKLFAAQTFRQKIEYDLKDLNKESLIELRNSILGLLHEYKNVKNISTQLAIGIADLAIQMNDGWPDPVGFMIDNFSTPEGASILLEFLMVLPEELSSNSKIVLESTEYLFKDHSLLKSNSVKVLQLLFSFLSQFKDDSDKVKTLECIGSWLRSGSIPVEIIESCNLVQVGFEALQNPSTFDSGCDILCELIIISGKKPIRESFVTSIYPGLISLIPFLKENNEDGEIVRGICRILVEAGESYSELIVSNFDAFYSILEGLLICASNEDLDIVKITINVWYVLSEQIIGPENEDKRSKFVNIYKNLIEILIRHMKYPSDGTKMSSQARDEFREFRHDMGDVLKDCVRVLGDEAALQTPYALISQYFGLDQEASSKIPWQDIEAPLFALRVMCKEVSEHESTYIPQIMSMLPNLPNHSKVKYSAILLIGRYAQWSNNHPELLPYQLDYVTQGFSNDMDNTIAAAHAFKDLCKYCKFHLVNYLEQLQPFYTQTIPKVQPEDKKEIAEAVSHLLSALPIETLPKALELFCYPVLNNINNLSKAKDIEQLKQLNDTVDELGNLLSHIEINTKETNPVVDFLSKGWVVIDQHMKVHGLVSETAEPTARCMRKIMEATQTSFAPLLPHFLDTMVKCFDQSKLSCYLWIAAKCVRVFGADPQSQMVVQNLIEHLTRIVFDLVQHPEIKTEEPDIVVEEYHYLLSQYIDSAPLVYLGSNLVQSTFQCALFCVSTTKDNQVVSAILKFLVDLFELTNSNRINLAPFASPIVLPLIQESGLTLLSSLFKGMVYNFSSDKGLIDDVSEIIYVMNERLGVQTMTSIITQIIKEFPVQEMNDELKNAFLIKISSILQNSQPVKLGTCLKDFSAAYARRNLINSRR